MRCMLLDTLKITSNLRVLQGTLLALFETYLPKNVRLETKLNCSRRSETTTHELMHIQLFFFSNLLATRTYFNAPLTQNNSDAALPILYNAEADIFGRFGQGVDLCATRHDAEQSECLRAYYSAVQD
mmetsp:Transcript_16279/g.40094  ORF Transcript_16279/g.40094 Transcript_16279/m.40094 type:complete len:127 (-) Transcript_16279:650-1030(-)